MNHLLSKLGIRLPIIQAPMAGVSTPEMAAAVSNAGGLGSIGVGNADAGGARAMIAAVRARTAGPLNVNLFCHAPAVSNPVREADWLASAGNRMKAVVATTAVGLRGGRISSTTRGRFG